MVRVGHALQLLVLLHVLLDLLGQEDGPLRLLLGLVSGRCILLLCHLLVVVELDLLHDHEVEPVHVLRHLAILAHHLSVLVLVAFELCQPLLLFHVHLAMLAGLEALSDATACLASFRKTLKLLQRLHLGLHDANVGLDELREVGEERVGRLEEVEPRIANLALGQALQELVAVFGHKLSSELDRFDLFVGERDVVDLKLLGRRWLNLFKHVHFLPRLDLLSQLGLEISVSPIVIPTFTVV